MRFRPLLAALALSGLPAAVGALPIPIPRVHYKALCAVDDQGHARCIRLDNLNRILTPDQVQKLLTLLDDLFPQLSGRKGSARNTLTDCGHGNWTRSNLTVPPSPPSLFGGMPGSSKRAPAFPSTTDAASLVSQCRATVQTDLDHAVQAGGADRAQFISNTVSQMDAAVSQCQDRSSPVASTGASQYVDARGRYSAAVDAVTKKYSSDDVANNAPGARAAYAAVYDAETLKKILDDLFNKTLQSDSKDRNQALSFFAGLLNEIAEGLEKTAQPAPEPATTPAPSPPAPSPAPAPEPPGVPPGLGPKPPGPNPTPPSGVGTPCVGEDCKPTCAQIAQGWDMFKAYCEQSNWQAYQCVAFLAAANHCVDPRLIHPSPDDDVPCPSNARVDKWTKLKKAWVDQCRKRSWVMMPVDQGKFLCVAPDFGATPPGFDPCTDPRAMPGPDDCGGPETPNPSSPRPVPKPDPHR